MSPPRAGRSCGLTRSSSAPSWREESSSDAQRRPSASSTRRRSGLRCAWRAGRACARRAVIGRSAARRWARSRPAVVRSPPEPTLDGCGTVRVEIDAIGQLEPVAAAACWSAWNAATLGYLAGLAARALELAVEHARAREQFGAPLAALPAVQSRLADAALATDAITLLAWAAPSNDGGLQEPELRFAGSACCDVVASSHQVHGAVGFALETGLHVYHRRARRHMPGRLPRATPPAESRQGTPLRRSGTCSMAQSSHSMRDSVTRIPPSRAIR